MGRDYSQNRTSDSDVEYDRPKVTTPVPTMSRPKSVWNDVAKKYADLPDYPSYLTMRNNSGQLADKYRVNAPQMNTDFSGLQNIRNAENMRTANLQASQGRLAGLRPFEGSPQSGSRYMSALNNASGAAGAAGSTYGNMYTQMMKNRYDTEKMGRDAQVKLGGLEKEANKANVSTLMSDIENQNKYQQGAYENLLKAQQGRDKLEALRRAKRAGRGGFFSNITDFAGDFVQDTGKMIGF